MMSLLVNLAALALIVFIVWWFWIAKPKINKPQSDKVEIIVADGVYTPSRIEVKVGKPITLSFIRKDPNPCAEKVVFDQLGITADLVIDQPREMHITITEAGEYSFTCQMQMYRGTLVAVS